MHSEGGIVKLLAVYFLLGTLGAFIRLAVGKEYWVEDIQKFSTVYRRMLITVCALLYTTAGPFGTLVAIAVNDFDRRCRDSQ